MTFGRRVSGLEQGALTAERHALLSQLVQEHLKAHGGDISVQSREGEGSLFTLHVPISNGSARNASEGS